MIYRKHGRSIRWENGTLIRVSESGWAREEGTLFECGPLGEVLRPIDEPESFTPAIPTGVNVERLIVTRGIAEHEYGDARWSEETSRVHVALTRGPLRAIIDSTLEQTGDIATIADALARAEFEERAAPPRLRLAPNVTAALLPALMGVEPPNVRLVQTAGAIDGYGQRVEEDTITFYRPSYRVRPVRMPFDLRLECDVTEIERDRPVAIALLAPVESLVLSVLIRDGERVYPARVRVSRIDAVSNERVWYPYGAGSFGAELML
ncbi:MAG TPA: hypothetical protein VF787_04150 [Thermoanaerobaculia bacterium]